MKVRIEQDKLFVEIELENPPKPSASGKTLVVASTHGNQNTGIEINGKALIVGLNAYTKR